MNNKKLFSIIGTVVALLVVGYLVFSAITAPQEKKEDVLPITEIEKKDVVVSIADSQVKAGEIVSAGVELENVSDSQIAGLEIDLSYDKNVFSEPKVVGTALLEEAGKSVSFNVIQEGLLKVLIVGINRNAIENGRIAEISFQTKAETEPNQFLLNINIIVVVGPDANLIDALVQDGIIEIIK